jgi:hypothetical protein
MKGFGVLLAGLFLTGSLLGNHEGFAAAAAGALQTVSGGGVTIRVTYLNPRNNEDPRFQVVLDTHSVNLGSYDLKALSVLRDEGGKNYVPSGVERKGSGHHREIVLTFPKPGPEAKRLELVIKEIAGVKERSFIWDSQ